MISRCTDAGRSQSHPTEVRDCSVVALANSAGISYQDAHRFAAQVGRKPRRGMKTDAIKIMLRNVDISGVAVTRELAVAKPVRPSNRFSGYSRPARRYGVSVTSFVRTLPKRGRFYLACTKHAFAYVNGEIVDNLERPMTRATMYLAYEIIPQSDVKPVPPITQAQTNELWERLNKLEAQRRQY